MTNRFHDATSHETSQDTTFHDKYRSRLFSRRPLDLRARLVVLHSDGGHAVMHARTRDISRNGAGLTVTGELAYGSAVVLCLRLPGSDAPLCVKAILTRQRGFRVGLRFVHTTAMQRQQIAGLCLA